MSSQTTYAGLENLLLVQEAVPHATVTDAGMKAPLLTAFGAHGVQSNDICIFHHPVSKRATGFAQIKFRCNKDKVCSLHILHCASPISTRMCKSVLLLQVSVLSCKCYWKIGSTVPMLCPMTLECALQVEGQASLMSTGSTISVLEWTTD